VGFEKECRREDFEAWRKACESSGLRGGVFSPRVLLPFKDLLVNETSINDIAGLKLETTALKTTSNFNGFYILYRSFLYIIYVIAMHSLKGISILCQSKGRKGDISVDISFFPVSNGIPNKDSKSGTEATGAKCKTEDPSSVASPVIDQKALISEFKERSQGGLARRLGLFQEVFEKRLSEDSKFRAPPLV